MNRIRDKKVLYLTVSAALAYILSLIVYAVMDGIEVIPYIIWPTCIAGLAIASGYVSWKTSGNRSSFICLLTWMLTFILPFFEAYSNPLGYAEKLLFLLILIAPFWITYVSYMCLAKITESKKLKRFACCIPCFLLLLLIVLIAYRYDASIERAEDHVCLALLILEMLITASVMEGSSRNKWKVLVICSAAAMMFFSYEDGHVLRLMTIWGIELFLITAPIVYTYLFAYYRKKYSEAYPLLADALYFGTCILIVVYSECIHYWKRPELRWSLDTCIYLLIISLIVFISEKRTAVPSYSVKKNLGRITVYIAWVSGMILAGNKELREFSFIANIDKGSKEYLEYLNRSGFRAYLLQSKIWVWLLVIGLILIVAISLLRIKWNSSTLNRVKNYLAVSYIIRTVLNIIMILWMIDEYGVKLPFICDTLGRDIMVLAMLFAFNKRSAGIVKEEKLPVSLESDNTNYDRESGGEEECGEMWFDGYKFYYDSEYEEIGATKISSKIRDFEFECNLTKKHKRYQAESGEKALVLYVSVPTFDSGDREWDSYRKMYLYAENGKMKGVLICGGYKVARTYTYSNVRCADENTELFLKNAGVFESDLIYKA